MSVERMELFLLCSLFEPSSSPPLLTFLQPVLSSMHLCIALLLFLLYAKQSASLVRSDAPTSNDRTPQLIRPANLIQAENQNEPLKFGTYYDIDSNLTIYIILRNEIPTQPLNELLHLSKERIHHFAVLYGPSTPVPRGEKHSNLTQTISAGLVYFLEPSRALIPHRPGLEWGEFETTTSWLYEHRLTLLNHRECNFVLFRRISSVTGQDINLGFGVIKPLNSTMNAQTGSGGILSKSVSHNHVEIN